MEVGFWKKRIEKSGEKELLEEIIQIKDYKKARHPSIQINMRNLCLQKIVLKLQKIRSKEENLKKHQRKNNIRDKQVTFKE